MQPPGHLGTSLLHPLGFILTPWTMCMPGAPVPLLQHLMQSSNATFRGRHYC